MHFRGWWEVAHGTKARHWEAVGLYLSDPFGVHSERQVKFSTCGMPMFVKSPTAVQQAAGNRFQGNLDIFKRNDEGGKSFNT